MRPHEYLPELAVIRDGEVEQLMDDDVIAECRFHAEQIIVEAQGACRGAGGQLSAHRADIDRVHLHIRLRSPFEDAGCGFASKIDPSIAFNTDTLRV